MAKSTAAGAATVSSRKKIGSKKPAVTAADIIAEKRGKKIRPLFYVASFLIPFLLTLIAYIGFGVYPFGERSVLTLDLNGQYIYYFEALRRDFWGDGSAFYSWSRNLSGGFMGIIGYYLASPFTLIIMVLPRKMILESMMIMQMTKVGAAGLTFSIYAQKSKGLKPLQSIAFSTMYAMMAYVVIQLIDPMWVDGPVFLPLIILGVEYLVDDGRKLNYIIPTAMMFVANFYIGFMIAIFIALYFVYYVFFGTNRKFKGIEDYGKTFGTMVLSTVIVLFCSCFMILPVYNALALGKFDFSVPDYSYKAMFNPLELVPCLLPNQYYSVNVDEGTRFYGRPEIYCGVLTFVLIPLFFMNKKIKRNKKVGYGLMVFALLFSMYVKPINMLWHGGQDPNWLPYRYSFLLSFVLVSMAAETFSKLDGYKMTPLSAGISAVTVGGLTAAFCGMMKKFNYNEEKYKYVAITPYKAKLDTLDTTEQLWLGTIAFGLILGAIYLIGVYMYSHTKTKKARNAITIVMACLIFFETGYNCFDSFRKIFKEVGNSGKSTYTEIISAPDVVKKLEEYDGGFYRAEKTFDRMVNDPLAYNLRGISHSSSVMNARAITFIETMGYFTQSFESKYRGSNPVADSILGIKYVLDDPARTNISNNLLDASYIKRFEADYTRDKDVQGHIDVYENPNALNIGYMADDDIMELSGLGNDNPFNSLNNFLSAMTGNTPSFQTNPIVPKQYYVPLDYTVNYDDSKVYLHDYFNDPDGDGNGTMHDCYEAFAGVNDAVVNVDVTVPKDGNIYMHLGSEMRRQCNVWVAVKGEDGVYRGQTTGTEAYDGYGQYFTTNSSPIVRMGPFNAGDEVEIRLTIPPTGPNNNYTGQNEYIMVRKNAGFNFYYLDEEAFTEDITKLKANQWEIDMDKTNDRHLVGEIDAQDGQVMVTTIPYEPGWKIQIDGKTIENLVVEETTDSGAKVLRNKQGVEGQVVVLGTLIGIRLPAGHHTVSMKYTPPGFNMGVVTLILGIIALVLFYRYDKKHNKVLIARKKRNELFKNKTVDEIVAELNKEAETSKSKSKKKKKPKPEKAEGSSEDTEEKTEAAETEANAEEKPAEKSKKKAKASLVVAVPESDKEEAEEAVNDAERFIRNADASLKEGITEVADEAEETAGEAAEELADKAEDIKDEAEDIAEEVSEAAEDAAEKAEGTVHHSAPKKNGGKNKKKKK
ncbi:YfhO family protein [Ruminococcus flavefaciens]|uniref:YfhO family protein n=1 Tax=Ruminococcus flavefaciens TaxID=1265 RepID=UPI001563BCC2|nr:YfhO family protein [Ruminococcus flavefaciens]